MGILFLPILGFIALVSFSGLIAYLASLFQHKKECNQTGAGFGQFILQTFVIAITAAVISTLCSLIVLNGKINAFGLYLLLWMGMIITLLVFMALAKAISGRYSALFMTSLLLSIALTSAANHYANSSDELLRYFNITKRY